MSIQSLQSKGREVRTWTCAVRTCRTCLAFEKYYRLFRRILQVKFKLFYDSLRWLDDMLHVTCLDDVKTYSRQIKVFSKFIFFSKRSNFFYIFHLPSLIAFFVLLFLCVNEILCNIYGFGECVRSWACVILMNVS
jgi:hypothetical protein